MSNLVMPTFEEMYFDCKDCGHMFQGRDCKKGLLGEITGGQPLLPLFGLLGPKCPECGKYNTEENPAVVY